MKDLFELRSASPMLIGSEGKPFDDEDYIFELKLDGERCLAYVDVDSVEFRNKRNNRLLPKFPELSNIYKQVKKRCILDGELTVLVDGKPDFSAVQRRTLLSNDFRIRLAAQNAPANFTAFDILYYDDKATTDLPLIKRKALLQKAIRENEKLAVSRYIEKTGRAFYALTKKQELEGIVAKAKDSLYHCGKRTDDWIKIKFMQDDDFVVCGFIPKDNSMNSIVLGKYVDDCLTYKGHVTLGVAGESFRKVLEQPHADCPFACVPKGNEDAFWLKPQLVCTVKYMHKTKSGGLRQPIFKGLRTDKIATECKE